MIVNHPDYKFFFLSDEKEKEFMQAPPEVRREAEALLEKCIKNTMQDLVNDTIILAINELSERVTKLEGK